VVALPGSGSSGDGATWRVFISHTSELQDFPKGLSYVAAVKGAISAAGHVIVDMAEFPAADQTPAKVCADRVRECDVYVGVLGTRYGSPVRDKPEKSYTELEFYTATEAGLDRLVFLLDTDAADLGIPPSALIDNEYGTRQTAFRRKVQDSLTTQPFTSPAALGQLVERSLRKLADTRTRIDSQIQPSAAESENSLYALASRAQQQWQDALTAVQDTVRLMDRAERRGAVPPGIDGWEYVDQLAVHKRLAKSMIELMVELESQSERVAQVVKEAKAHVEQLRERGFVQLPGRLAPMIESVSDFEGASSGLLNRMMRLLDDLDNRGCSDYEVSCETLSRAREQIEDASNEATSVMRGLQRMQAGSSPRTAPTARSAGPHSDRGATPSGLTGTTRTEEPGEASISSAQSTRSSTQIETVEADARPIPLLWKIAAGEPILADEPNVREYLVVPDQYVHSDNAFMLEVEGDSMTGEDGVLNGDYVIVDPDERWDDGDMVAVLLGADEVEEGKAAVKRVWKEGDRYYLQSSNLDPQFAPIILERGGEQEVAPQIYKVIGVMRWHVKKGRRRAEPPS
jgi:SOS-response transcriptional repressor LexA